MSNEYIVLSLYSDVYHYGMLGNTSQRIVHGMGKPRNLSTCQVGVLD